MTDQFLSPSWPQGGLIAPTVRQTNFGADFTEDSWGNAPDTERNKAGMVQA